MFDLHNLARPARKGAADWGGHVRVDPSSVIKATLKWLTANLGDLNGPHPDQYSSGALAGTRRALSQADKDGVQGTHLTDRQLKPTDCPCRRSKLVWLAGVALVLAAAGAVLFWKARRPGGQMRAADEESGMHLTDSNAEASPPESPISGVLGAAVADFGESLHEHADHLAAEVRTWIEAAVGEATAIIKQASTQGGWAEATDDVGTASSAESKRDYRPRGTAPEQGTS